MTERITIDLQDGELLAALNRTLALLDHPWSMMNDIGDAIESNVNIRWSAKVDPTGAPWAPRSTSEFAKMWNRRKYDESDIAPGTLLDATNQLRRTLTHNTGDDWVDIGTSRQVPGKSQPTWQVGFLHEFGTVRMPRRGLLTADPHTGQLGAADQADVLRIVNEHLSGAFG